MSAVDEVVFQMPEVKRGKIVDWYKPGVQNPVPESAYVEEVFNDQVVLRTIRGRTIFSVRHKDDSRLDANPEWKTPGTWDFTADEKQSRATLTTLQVRIGQLESRVKALEGKR